MTMKQSRFKRICVFCGSSQGKKASYHDAAVELGNQLVTICVASPLSVTYFLPSMRLSSFNFNELVYPPRIAPQLD